MATLSLSLDFSRDLQNLPKAVLAKIPKLVEMFSQQSVRELNRSKGIHLETHTNQLDPNARTIRIDKNHRGILYDCGDNETFILTRIGTHDFTDRWMQKNTFKVNPKTGAVEIIPLVEGSEIDKITTSLEAQNTDSGSLLFSHRSEKDFQKLGIEQNWINIILLFDSEEMLETVFEYLPQAQAESVIELLDKYRTIEEIYSRVAGAFDNTKVDTDDFVAALKSPASSKHFVLLTEDHDLNEIFEKSIAEWRIFLHHTQKEIAYELNYDGPTLIVGAAGTGKTVVAMHRTKALAAQYGTADAKRILFTTFHPSLADRVEKDLDLLGGANLLNHVDVVSIDRLAKQIAMDTDLADYELITDDQAKEIWKICIDQSEMDHGYSSDFLNFHWQHFVLANSCNSLQEYLQLERVEDGKKISEQEKTIIWELINSFLEILNEKQQMTFKQYTNVVASNLQSAKYKHIIVDESQDLHEADWRLLRSLVDPGPNDMFIVGDTDQRIYDNRAALEDLGINIDKRKYSLGINYRTSKEIASWAKGLLNNQSSINDSFIAENVNDCKSLTSGPDPTMIEASDIPELSSLLISKLNKWIQMGVQEDAIVVASRSRKSHPKISAALEHAGLNYSIRTPSSIWESGIQIASLHTLKGHEFRCVALFDISEGVVPSLYFQNQYEGSETELERYFQRELSLLYMAATRARDDLWIGWVNTPSTFLEPIFVE